MSITRPSRLTALLQLASPALPIGGFSYSQGLEAAIAHGLVADADGAAGWIADALSMMLGPAEAPVWVLQHRHWQAMDIEALSEWNTWFLCSRESRELRLETEQMGWSLAQLIDRMQWGSADLRQALQRIRPLALPTAYPAAACALGLDGEDGLTAYLFAWAENQVAAALKAVPLGQMAGQRILTQLHEPVAAVVREAIRRADAQPAELSTFAPQFGLLSARHETQYSRLFRS